MKRKLLLWVKSIAVPLLTGLFAAVLTRNGMNDFAKLDQPPLSPPAWLFPIVWTILYVLMGMAYYLVQQAEEKDPSQQREKDNATVLYGLQLMINFFWPILFFGLNWYFVSFLWIIFLWIILLWTIFQFRKISKKAAYLLLPYFIWVTFAAYLNFGVWIIM